MSSQKLSVGVAGCGGIAQYTFQECRGLECLRIAAAYDPDPDNLAKFRSENTCDAADSFEALLARKDVEAVVLAAPPYIRPSQALLAIQAGKPIYTEKPLSLTIGEGRQVVDAAHVADVPLMVGHVLRYFGGFGVMAEHILAGEYGKPLALQVHRFGPPFPANFRVPWRMSRELSGGLLFEVHVHEFDFSRYLCGNPKDVFASGHRIGTDPDTDYSDLYMGTINFESGTIGQYHFSQITPCADTSFVVYLEKGVAKGGFENATFQPWEGEELTITSLSGESELPYRKEVRLFAEAVLKGEPMPIPGEEGLWAVAMAEGFEKSAETGEVVSLEELGHHEW